MRCRVVALRFSLRTIFVFMLCLALLPVADVALLMRGQAQTPNQSLGRSRRGKPEGALPDLEDVQRESQIEREPPAPIPSTVRSPKLPRKPWDGRRVGDPFDQPPGQHSIADNVERPLRLSNRVRRAHASATFNPPPVLDDQFVQNFFSLGLARNPASDEATYWNDQLRVAYGQGQASLKLAALELGRTLFESADYAARNRDNHWYVYDLYKTYLMRDPDSTGWANWEATVPTSGREYVRRGFEESTEFANLIATITLNGSATANAASLISARIDPRNQAGNGMLTRDASWSVPLLSLPGRAGLDLGLVLSYSSMVWTRSGPYLYFDEDVGFPSPGFRLGFPTIEPKVFDAQTARNAYLLITNGGKRVELRQVGSTNNYDATDSSYLRLTDSSGSLAVYATDGTKLSFTWANGKYYCSEVKDRNGNYLTISYNSLGRLTNITDTLGRVVTFNYDSNQNLLSITQAWNGQPAHQWVSFGWAPRTMQSSFTSGRVTGTANGTTVPVITQVTLNDTSYFTFDYTNSLQVSVIRNNFGATERNATSFTYETPAGDVPRLVDSRVSARNWTGVNGVPSQVITQYSVASDGACVLTAADGTVYKEYYGTGWQRGLTTLSEVWSGGVRQKWTTTAWTQDSGSVGYEVNPRVTETNIYDASGNHRRTLINYSPYADYGLPAWVKEFDANGAELRQTFYDYNLSQAYLDRRIIGLLSQVLVTNIYSYQTKITYEYDDAARLQSVPVAATQHDAAYSSSFTVRGNLTAVSRWDATDSNNAAKKLTSYTNYYNTGTPISTTDPAGHQNSISYTDSFSDGVTTRYTFAYPTTLTDADGFSSTVQYNYDFGATTRTQSAAPAGQTQGAIQTMTYNSLGQLERVTTSNNSAYKRFWYGLDYTASYATVNNVADELYSIQVVDGLGRTIGAAGNHPGSNGGYRLVNTIYNQMGQLWKVSNPTEVNSSWVPSGDDGAGMYYTQQTYDWKGRPHVTTNTDGTTKEASYSGCGCAGGQVVTLTDEGTIDAGVAKRRQQKIYADVLGRTVKTEILNWQGGSVYSATVNTYNARDQIEYVRQYAGPEGSATFQNTIMIYDGYGRLKTKHLPEQDTNTATLYTYNADDTINTITDARGATVTYGHNARHLVTSMSYSAPAGIISTSNATFAYDAAGNRTSMTDGIGTRSYGYNQLSRLTSETQTFTGLSGSYALTYGYNLAGGLTSLAEPSQYGAVVNYSYDSSGRLGAVTGSGGLSAQLLTGIQYRAWGTMKYANYGDGPQINVTYNARLLPTRYEMNNIYLSQLINPGYFTVGSENQYYADGRLRYARDLQDGNFDRAFAYDHAGRLKEAYSGREARGVPPNNPADSPYRQSYSYDVWNNMGRTGRHWTTSISDTPSYTNDRRADWSYDASGNVISRDENQRTHAYDDAGQQRQFYEEQIQSFGGGHWLWHQYTIDQTYYADGHPGKHIETRYSEDENGVVEDYTDNRYQLRSSVLGGALIVEIDQFGSRWAGHVYAGGELLADYYNSAPNTSTVIQHRNPSTGQWVKNAIRTELDPLGADVGYFNPYTFSLSYADMMGSDNLYYIRGNAMDIRGGCALDGMPISCSELRERELSPISTVSQEATLTDNTVIPVPVRSEGPGIVIIWKPDPFATLDEDPDLALLDALGHEELSSPAEPQKILTEDDPKTIPSEGSKNCRFTISFEPGLYDNNANYPNGPGEVLYKGTKYFGLGFTVTGATQGGGGIGHIGNDINPSNHKGQWTLDQYTSNYAKQNGDFVTIDHRVQQGGPAWQDINSKGIYFATDWTNKFSRYDHPSLLADVSNTYKNQAFLIKVFRGKEVCQAEFHIVQRGNTIHWGRGGQGAWPN